MKMLIKIALPKMGELLVMMMTMISPSEREVPLDGIAPPEGKSAPAQVSPRGGDASSRKSFPYFFLGQNDLYTRRWAPEVGRAEHNPPVRVWGARRALVSCAHQVAPLRWLFAPVFLIYSIKNAREVSACSELCRIGGPT